MLDVAPKALIAKVNPLCLKALEGAIGMCVSNTNAHVEIEHWLLKLLEPANSDLTKIFKHCDVDTARVTREVQKSLEKLRRGHDRSPSLGSERGNARFLDRDPHHTEQSVLARISD